jgi:hypothetical protein
MSTQKIINANDFNEGGAVTFTDVVGNFSVLQNSVDIRDALPQDYYRYGITEYTTISAGAATQELAAAIAGRQIQVLSYVFVCDEDSTVTFKSGSTDISGGMAVAANGGVSATGEDGALMTTNVGEALNITNSVGNIAGHVTYRII